jgi:hypothetical protein
VLRDLDHIRDTCRGARHRNGYFAAMYGRVTAGMAERAAAGRFDDDARMEDFVARFARRYTDAYWARAAAQPTTRSWALAFDTAETTHPLVVQHLLLGMNAHINLDLGIVVAELAQDRSLPLDAVKGDFDEVNDVLAELVDRCQAAVVEGSPLLAAADTVLGDHDEAATRFSLRVARAGAWDFARSWNQTPAASRRELVVRRDASVAEVGRRLLTRDGVVHTAQRLVRLLETSSVPDVIDRLSAVDVSDTSEG